MSGSLALPGTKKVIFMLLFVLVSFIRLFGEEGVCTDSFWPVRLGEMPEKMVPPGPVNKHTKKLLFHLDT